MHCGPVCVVSGRFGWFPIVSKKSFGPFWSSMGRFGSSPLVSKKSFVSFAVVCGTFWVVTDSF